MNQPHRSTQWETALAAFDPIPHMVHKCHVCQAIFEFGLLKNPHNIGEKAMGHSWVWSYSNTLLSHCLEPFYRVKYCPASRWNMLAYIHIFVRFHNKEINGLSVFLHKIHIKHTLKYVLPEQRDAKRAMKLPWQQETPLWIYSSGMTCGECLSLRLNLPIYQKDISLPICWPFADLFLAHWFTVMKN